MLAHGINASNTWMDSFFLYGWMNEFDEMMSGEQAKQTLHVQSLKTRSTGNSPSVSFFLEHEECICDREETLNRMGASSNRQTDGREYSRNRTGWKEEERRKAIGIETCLSCCCDPFHNSRMHYLYFHRNGSGNERRNERKQDRRGRASRPKAERMNEGSRRQVIEAAYLVLL